MLAPPFPGQVGFLPGAVNIPVGQLRKRMGEVPQGKKLYVYCQVGGGRPASGMHAAAGRQGRLGGTAHPAPPGTPCACQRCPALPLGLAPAPPAQVGLRGYYACRQLRLAGHEQVWNISGGFKSYKEFRSAGMTQGQASNGAKL